MNEFFGMTIERLEEIQAQIRAISESLDPLGEQVCEQMSRYEADADVETLEESQLIAAGGLLSRLRQSLVETDFWIQGVRSYMDADPLDRETCVKISEVVVNAYGGLRDPDKPYGSGEIEETIGRMMSEMGLGGLFGGLGGFGVVIRVTEKPEAAPDPVA